MNGVHVLYIPPTTPYSVRHTHSVPVHKELTSNSSCACSISLSYSRSMQSIWGGAMTVTVSYSKWGQAATQYTVLATRLIQHPCLCRGEGRKRADT